MNIKDPSINSAAAMMYCTARMKKAEQFVLPKELTSQYIKNLNYYIFEDMKNLGIDYPAGSYRDASQVGELNISLRPLSNGSEIYCMRSYLDKKAMSKFENALSSLDFDKLRKLNTKEFTQNISDLYARLDYTHPFIDGNSRTFRTFTKQVANKAGFDLDWSKTSASNELRDSLYCARGICVNKLALEDPSQAAFKDYIENMIYGIKETSHSLDINGLLSSLNMVAPYRSLDLKNETQMLLNSTHNDYSSFLKEIPSLIMNLKNKYPEIEKTCNLVSGSVSVITKKKKIIDAYAFTSQILLPSFYNFLKDGYRDENGKLLISYIDSMINQKIGKEANKDSIEKYSKKVKMPENSDLEI